MLVGIVVTNAIVLVDLVNQYRDRGMNVRDALVHGASRRLRPILMTALATIFALLPMAIGLTGTGGFISQPLARRGHRRTRVVDGTHARRAARALRPRRGRARAAAR